MIDAEDYIASLATDALRSYASGMWRYLSGASDWLPDAPFFGLAPIEVRVVNEELDRFGARGIPTL
jgi:hypothetical protein